MTTLTTEFTTQLAPVATARHRPGVASRPRQPAGSLRLTRRGRALLVLALLGLLLGLGFTFGQVSASRAAGSASTAVVTVRPGDTLWTIAVRVAPHHDTRQIVAALESKNHLRDASVQVGQRLVVPA